MMMKSFLVFLILLKSQLSVSPPMLYELISEIVTPHFQGLHTFKYFHGESVSDANSNYGLMLGLDEITLQILQQAVCSKGLEMGVAECHSDFPHQLIGMHDITDLVVKVGLDASFARIGDKIPPFYVRAGYTADETIDFYCARFDCIDDIKHSLRKLWELDMNPLTSETLRSKFERVYNYQIWGKDDVSSGGGSGTGSSKEGAQNIRHYLPLLLKELTVKSIVDAGCGAMTWMPDALLSASASIKANQCGQEHSNACLAGELRYVGVDIASTAIARAENIALQYNHNGHWTFHRMDITTQQLPGVPDGNAEISDYEVETMRQHGLFDLVIARDIFFHLPFHRIMCALNHFSKMAIMKKQYINATEKVYLLATTENLTLGNAAEVPVVVDTAEFLPMGSYR